ncbi:hypothetical protein MAPG_06975 [Magnaporthiopsis poae ATCC 64411]|uniref:Uncharacterized protein n=1 Tax=Magnaporthiopsis poae (strain ATCC 64411 / 73-15) TaxID=644358 RepID=A0A0C4E3H6_MAGP6|nr:hypothetical protein MAPG_06975 [Magnaporthiopsis poae ATCC 64411]
MDAIFESVAALVSYRSTSSPSIYSDEGDERDTMRDNDPMTSCTCSECGAEPPNTAAPVSSSRPASPERERLPRDDRAARDSRTAKDDLALTDRAFRDDRAGRPAPPPRAGSDSSRAYGQHMTTASTTTTTSRPAASKSDRDKIEELRGLNDKLMNILRDKDELLREKDAYLRERDSELLKYSQEYSVIHAAWTVAEDKLAKQTELLTTLQQEALANVDRHEPTFDATVVSAFVKVNRAIDSLVRKGRKGVVTLLRFVEAEGAATVSWREGALPDYCADTRVPEVAERTSEVLALMLRAMVWNMLGQRLFHAHRPFAAFASSTAGDLERSYQRIFVDHKTNEMAAKWRALSARCLADFETKADARTEAMSAADPKTAGAAEGSRPGKQSYQDRVVQDLMADFAATLHEDLGCRDKFPDEIQEVLRPAFEPVLLAAIEMASLTARERAGYSLAFPDLAKTGFDKIADDPHLTNRPTDVGMNASGDEDELEGPFAVVASPMLIKWGTGSGERLDESTVLCKAFVWRPRRD